MYVVPENIHTPRWKEFEKAYPHPTTQPQGLGLGLSLSLSLSHLRNIIFLDKLLFNRSPFFLLFVWKCSCIIILHKVFKNLLDF